MHRTPSSRGCFHRLLGLALAVSFTHSPAASGQTPSAPAPAPPPSVAAADAAKPAAPKPEPGTLDSFFNGALPDAIGRSRIHFETRLRWEHADQTGLDASDAFTLRTRFGLTTATLYGFQGMIEGENITVLGSMNNAYYPGETPNGKTTVADPPTTEINQAWLSYTHTNWHTMVKGGRERLVLDNQRFIGDVNWRQNQQTFDAVTLENWSVKDLRLAYSWIGQVQRIYGNVSGLAPALRDFDSDSHLIHASYAACEYARLTGSTYLLDLENAGGNNNSCASYGFSLTGKAKVHEKVTLDYRGELAWQTDYADSTLDYGAPYYHLEAGATVKPVAFGVGYEVLGADGGTAVRTPLATLHAFNGWADVFLTTPNAGLRDFYAYAQVTLPAAIPLRFVYHKFNADTGSGNFGQEFDLLISKKLGKHWALLGKYAYYDGKDAPFPPSPAVDVHRFWAQLEFVF